MRQFIEAGKINNTHGVKGGVKIESWCDTPAVLSELKTLYIDNGNESFAPLKVVRSVIAGERVISFFEGIDSIEKAERLKNRVVFANRDDIPLNGGVLIDDIKGLPVIDESTNRVYGTLKDVIRYGVRDIYEIECDGKTVLLPAVKEFIRRIDTESGVFVTPIDGFFDEN